MEWQNINATLIRIREHFDKSYKCLAQNRSISNETISRHATILVACFNQARSLIHDNRGKLNAQHWSYVSRFLHRLRTNLNSIKSKYSLDITIPSILNTPTLVEEETNTDLETVSESEIASGSDTHIKEEDLGDLTIPAVITLAELSETEPESVTEVRTINMAMSQVEFLKLASSLIPEFSGKSENLQSFIDALSLVDSLKGTHEATAVNLIKTKLKGHVRNLINTEQTILSIIDKLKSGIKGESAKALSAKLFNLQQRQKTASQYIQEVEQLTRALQSAHMINGVSQEYAEELSLQVAVKSIITNSTIDEVRSVMKSRNFNSMSEITTVFVDSCTDAVGHPSTVLYAAQQQRYKPNRGFNRGNYRGNYRNNGNRYNYNNNYNNYGNNGNRGQYRGNSRGRGNSNRGHNNNNGNNNNVRIAQNASGNSQQPLGTQQ